jgi:hypothetical protein
MLPLLMRRNRLPFFETPGGPGGGGTAPPAAPPADPGEAGPFSLAYVKELREENKSRRIEAKAARDALFAVGSALGLAPEHLSDPDRVKVAASNLRITATVDEAITRHGVDRRLTRALMDSERSLAPLADLTPAEIPSELDRIITELLKQNPALKAGAAAGPARSGLPIAGPGAANQQRISPRELRQLNLPPERVAELHRQGLIDLAGER